jgi:hypothetical protein
VASKRNLNERMQAYQEKYRKITAKLSDIGFIWPGHIQRRYLTCGKPNCVCHTDPEAKHGPYAYWTSKETGKTVSRMLRPEEADLLEQWIVNRRELEAVVRQMKGLSKKVFSVALTIQKDAKEG